jgi:G3E family GTPase
MALLVNELGRIGVDGALLSGQDVDMVELTSGCICCTMKTDFIRAVQEIRERVSPDLLIVEATGVAQPGDILENLVDPPLKDTCRVQCLVTVVNAELFRARDVFGPFYENQIRFADVLVLNKIDLVEPETLEDIRAELRALNAHAVILPTEYCSVDPARLFPASLFQHGGDRPHGGHHHVHAEEIGFQSFSFEGEEVLDRERLEAFLKALPPTLFRLKGWVRLPDFTALLDFSTGRYRIAPYGQERGTALAFVGRHCDETAILAALKDCVIDRKT